MKIKKIFMGLFLFLSLFLFVGCDLNAYEDPIDDPIEEPADPGTTETPGTTDPGTETPGTETPGTETPGTETPGTETPGTETPGTETPGTTDPTFPELPENATIYLAGDSTVKTYEDDQYIGGWGQYLDLFLDDTMTVINCAQGGRSSRSFINEGRLYNIEGNNYSFSQNDGNSIEDCIKAGDYLFIQFGHNDDDTKKASSYSTMFDRMVPLGTPDANGIYPVTEGSRVATTYLPDEYTSKVSSTSSALNEIAKYGSSYYAYDCGGTYKWFLKEYIDFAREKGAVPVLVTPVARVKYNSEGTIIGGQGLHGENFAYVQAVRQLAEEEDCLLIDLFADSKEMLETATPTYGNYVMALKPNDLVGAWPTGYDSTYGVASLGYTGIEGTHYNKYGAYLQAAYVAEAILANTEKHNDDYEYYAFKDHVLTTPEKFIDPSNLISKSVVKSIEDNFTTVKVTNPNRQYNDPQEIVTLITALAEIEVTNDNYKEVGAQCEAIRAKYYLVNIDDRAAVTNYETLVQYEATVEEFVIANRPKPIKTVIMDVSTLETGEYTNAVECGEFTIVGASGKAVKVMDNAVTNFVYNGTEYSIPQYISLGGSASFGKNRYISFATEGACTITVVAKSSSSSSDRILNFVSASDTGTNITTFDAKGSLSITSYECAEAGTYYLGSAGSGIYVYSIIIEYFA